MARPPYRVVHSPMTEWPPLNWPDDARVACWVAPPVEHDACLPAWDITQILDTFYEYGVVNNPRDFSCGYSMSENPSISHVEVAS